LAMEEINSKRPLIGGSGHFRRSGAVSRRSSSHRPSLQTLAGTLRLISRWRPGAWFWPKQIDDRAAWLDLVDLAGDLVDGGTGEVEEDDASLRLPSWTAPFGGDL
jgi:hypothetical protein